MTASTRFEAQGLGGFFGFSTMLAWAFVRAGSRPLVRAYLVSWVLYLGQPEAQFCPKMRFLAILKSLKIHQKINFCSVRGVNGKSRGQEMSIFDDFDFFENSLKN